MYEAKIVLDSMGPAGVRLTTWELTYPRFVHAELMTHRVFSRNSASSRAIPVAKMLERIKNDPVLPKWWGKNQSGMQADEELSPAEIEVVQKLWLEGRDTTVNLCECLSSAGLHKQLANRPLEAWMFITVLVTSSSFANWFKLRHNKFAQPEIGWLAGEMYTKYKFSKPNHIAPGGWHLPFISDEDIREVSGRDRHTTGEDIWSILRKISTGRCARVTHLTHNGKRDLEEDIKLHDKLVLNGHWSPFEHPAMALTKKQWSDVVQREINRAQFEDDCFNPMRLGNFVGWNQYRKTFREEHGFDFPYQYLETAE